MVVSNLIQSYCAQGASLSFVTDTTPMVVHVVRTSSKARSSVEISTLLLNQAESILGAGAALLFFKDRLEGVPFPKGCSFSNVTAFVPNTPLPPTVSALQ